MFTQTIHFMHGRERRITGEGRRRKGKCHQGTCMKDPWTKPNRGGSSVGGRDGWGFKIMAGLRT